MSEEPQMVQVWSCQGWDLAQIYKSKLEWAGIPSLLKYEAAGLVFGITVDGLGQVRILVPEEYAGEARALLEEAEDTLSGEWDGEEPSPQADEVAPQEE